MLDEPEAGQNLLCNQYSSNSFARKHRLLRKNDFNLVLRSKPVKSKILNIFYIDNHVGNARLGIIVSKKIFHRAVERNQVKRLIREAFRLHDIKFLRLDIVVIVKSLYTANINPELQKSSLISLFDQIQTTCAGC